MPEMLVSFGYKYGIPSRPVQAEDVVFDVRSMFTKNPYNDKTLRSLRGDHPSVAAHIQDDQVFQKNYDKLKSEVLRCKGTMFLGCTGGHHRSVYLADRLSKELGVPCTHLNYND